MRDLENFFTEEDFDNLPHYMWEYPSMEEMNKRASTLLRDYIKEHGKVVFLSETLETWHETPQRALDTHTAILIGEKEIK